MLKIKFDAKLMKYISLFESLTHAEVKDCIESESILIFIVEEGQIAKAIGKRGINVKRIENMLKRKIKIVEFNKELEKFIANLIYPTKAKEIKAEDRIVTIESADSKSRGYMIGRNASILRSNESIVKRYFDIDEIKVV